MADEEPEGIVERLRSLLGQDIVLLSIPRGSKRPKAKGWQSLTAAVMQRPEYVAELNHGGNIGVLLGRGLVTIDLDRDEEVEHFLHLNPKLRDTLQTKRKRGCNLWLRIKGPCPKSSKLKNTSGDDFGEWRADGNQTVIHGAAIDKSKGELRPTSYKIVKEAPPLELEFSEIRWPEELVLPWSRRDERSAGGDSHLAQLHQHYGEPYYTNKEGEPCKLNEPFWSGLFALENSVLWEPVEHAFYDYRPDIGIYEDESNDAIKRRLSERLLQASRQMPCFWLEKQRTDARLNSLVAQIGSA